MNVALLFVLSFYFFLILQITIHRRRQFENKCSQKLNFLGGKFVVILKMKDLFEKCFKTVKPLKRRR